MAFDFLGVLTREKFEEFEEFLNEEVKYFTQRIYYLFYEIDNIYKLINKFKTADLKLRGKYAKSKEPDYEWVVIPRDDEPRKPIPFSSATTADMIYLKRGLKDQIKFRRERNEYKVKRLRDLAYQYETEIDFITKYLDSYEEILEKIKGRFNTEEYKEEMAEIAPLKETDVSDDKRAIAREPGYIEEDGIKKYFISFISSARKEITFQHTVPPLKYGDTITLIDGSNEGIKSFAEYINSSTIRVLEELISEDPVVSLAIIQRAT